MAKPLELDEIWVDRIKQMLNGLEYGSVQIVVHDGKIAQIDKTERKRFDAPSQPQSQLQAVKSVKQTSKG
ncbi:YezD family protein [Paenibacillus alginolyticus]|uniref:YezD family protein n=1 Tax=Paenibacillus alginolyticus TaxID=59839 RepID=A0ABT4GLC4_9BACL|nr:MULTISPECIES: YezD family protein [Paenibacillus]MCY9696990.1 YezD family protein [Paenibacillus alginolyticus]MEC0147376.1 YezD family protein [Paenibacillus alginolyticus]NRF96078.1 YezD family protein [Paenibacillus frigoriresistens]